MISSNSLTTLGAAGDEPLFWWPGDVKNLANVVDFEFEGVNRHAGGDADFGNLYSRWKTYKQEIDDTWFMLGGSDSQAIQDYRKQLQFYYDKFGVQGVPRPLDQKDPFSGAGDTIDSLATAIKWAAILGGGAYLLSQLGLLKGVLPRFSNPSRWFYLPRSRRRKRRRRVTRRGRRRQRVSRVRLPKPRRRGGRMTYPWKNAYGRYVYYTAENYPVKRKRRR